MPREYLLFRLSGPLASWGEIAVGERRSSWPRPSKSAVLGLVAAALGYDRHDAPAHAALNDGLRFAIRVDIPARAHGGGVEGLKPLRDYHTAQVPSARRNRRWSTRAEELANPRELNTILSERWYWTHMTATASLWPSGESTAPPLEAMKDALDRPKFALYLGRKSCPPGRPLFAQTVNAEAVAEAFALYDKAEATAAARAMPEHGKMLRDMIFCALASSAGGEIWADKDAVAPEHRAQIQARRDAIRDRRAWTFSERAEARIKTGGTDAPL